jgi:hypothetical protein
MRMFGYVTASVKELTPEQRKRYNAVYCGICRRIRVQSSQVARLGLRYDMAFLALLLMSLYEPEEETGDRACLLHPLKPKPWVDNKFVRYAADMNVALAYYKFLDDWQDDRKVSAKLMAEAFGTHFSGIEMQYPRQCDAIRNGIRRLSELEKSNCPNPDEPAGVFGDLMAELFVVKEDLWAPALRQMGCALGRFIYLLDAALDFEQDRKKGKYNPYLAMGMEKDWPRWEEYLVLTIGRCTASFEMLPLVQDKALLDNILYSGVWVNDRGRKEEDRRDRRSL